MRAGQYREQIQLLFPGSTVSDGIGGWIRESEGPEVPVWARIQVLKGAQVLAVGKEINTQAFKICIRYRPDAIDADRLKWKDQMLKILSVVSDERRTETTLYAVNGS